MQAKIIVSLLLIFLPAVNHASEGMSGNSGYYPLQIGNKWEYDYQYTSYSEEFSDTLRVNGNLYYGLTPIYFNAVEYWLRNDEGVIKVLNMGNNQEFTLYDFTAQVGSSWSLPAGYECYFGNQVTLTSITDTVVTPAGTFYNCFQFTHTPQCVDAGLFNVWFAEGVGKVKFFEENIAGMLIFQLTNFSPAVGIFRNENPAVIENNQLMQNYPNPFNAETVIPYSLTQRAYVSIKIYNLLGQEIISLVNDFQDAGMHTCSFNGEKLISGIYCYNLEVNNIIMDTKKLIYLK